MVKGPQDLVGCGDSQMNTPVWVSEPVDFLAEWRTFIRYGRVIGVRMYKGDWRAQYDYKVIESAVAAYKDAPAGYALDYRIHYMAL